MSRAAADVDALPPPPPETWQDRATYWRYRSIWGAAAGMPGPVVERLPDRLGPVWFRNASESQRARVTAHLRRIVGPDVDDAALELLTREAYVEYARYWVDSFRLHRLDHDAIVARTSTENVEVVDELLAEGGAVLATGHVGSWDLAGQWTTLRGWPVTVVAEVVEPRRLFDRFVQLRRDAGMGVIPLVKGGDMIGRLTDVVRGGGLATLLADRDLTGRGPVVSLFGEPCRLPGGSAVLARETGCPVVVGAVMTAGRHRWRAVIQGEPMDLSGLSVQQGTQQIAWRLEELLRRFPTQWHVFVRQWLVDREPDHPAVAAWRRDPDGWLDDPSWREED